MPAEVVRLGNTEGPEGVRTMLLEALSDIERNDFPAQKAVLIFLDDRPTETGVGVFNIRQYTSGVRCSEVLAILAVAKSKFLSFMGH